MRVLQSIINVAMGTFGFFLMLFVSLVLFGNGVTDFIKEQRFSTQSETTTATIIDRRIIPGMTGEYPPKYVFKLQCPENTCVPNPFEHNVSYDHYNYYINGNEMEVEYLPDGSFKPRLLIYGDNVSLFSWLFVMSGGFFILICFYWFVRTVFGIAHIVFQVGKEPH